MQHDLIDVMVLQFIDSKVSFGGLHGGYMVFRPGMGYLIHIIKGAAGAFALLLQIVQAVAGH